MPDRKSRCGPGDGDRGGASWQRRLLAVAGPHLEASGGESLPDSLQQVFAVFQRTVKGFSRGLAGEVVFGGAQSAREDEHHRPAGQALADGRDDGLSVVDHAEGTGRENA